MNYVSLPRYPSTKALKGFAFVEFATVEGVKACLDAIGTKEFSSVHPFPKAGSKDIQRMERTVMKSGEERTVMKSGEERTVMKSGEERTVMKSGEFDMN